MFQLSIPPFNLISLLREHLSSEDVRTIADDYGERCGRETSFYHHLIERAGIDHVVRLLVLYAERRKDSMGLIRVICEHRADLRQPLQASGFEFSSLVQAYLAATMQELSTPESSADEPLALRYVSKNAGTLEKTEQGRPSSPSQSPPASLRSTATRWLEVDLEEFLLSHTHITLFGSDRMAIATTLRQIFKYLAFSWQASDPASPLPIFVPLEKWFNPQMNLVQFLQFQISWLGMPQLAEQVPDLLRIRQIVLLFDGLDELPYVKRNEKTGLLDDPRFHAIARLGDKFSEESGWRNIRCILSCRVKDFVIGTHWHDQYVLNPAHKQSVAWPTTPAQMLKGQVSQAFERKRATGSMTDAEAVELQTRLGYLALNMTDAQQSSAEKQLAAAWLFHLREIQAGYIGRHDHEPEADLEERQQAARLLRLAEDAGLLSSTENEVRFSDRHLQHYFCLCYCRSQALDDPQLLAQVSQSQFREVWWLWSELDDHLVDQLLYLLTNSGSSDLRSDAVRALSWLNDKRAVDPLIEALKDESSKVRWCAAFALGVQGNSRAVEPLIATLEDTDELVRGFAIEALSKINDNRVIEPLIKAIKDDRRGVGYRVISALSEIHDTWVIEPLILWLDAYSASGKVGQALIPFGEAAVLPLMAAITPVVDKTSYARGKKSYTRYHYSSAAGARYSDAEILGEIGDLRPLPILMWMAENDRDETGRYDGSQKRRVSHAAEEAVHKILQRHRMIAPLLALQRNKDSAVSIAATFALGEHGDRRAVEPLIVALQHEEPHIRWGAARLLGDLGDDRAIVPLIAALEDQELEADTALYKFGEAAVLPLIEALKDEEKMVRRRAAWILGRLQDRRAVEPLIATLADKESSVRAAAVRALAELGDRQALEHLVAAAHDPDSEVRELVIDARRRLDPEQAILLLIEALKDEDKEVRYSAARDLHMIKSKDSRLVEPLIAALKDEYHYVREYAGYALKYQGDSRAVQPLIETLNDESVYAAMAAAGALGAIGDSRAIEPLVAALKNEYDKHCSIVVESLIKFGEPVILPLLGVLGDEGPNAFFYSSSSDYWDWTERTKDIENAHLHYYAAEILGEVGDVGALPILMWMAEKDRNETKYGEGKVQDAAAQALESIRQRHQDIASLLKSLDDQEPLVRIGAGFALGSLGDQRAIETLIEALKNSDRRTRWGAAGLLGNFGGDQAIAPLTHALGDEDTEVRRNAAATLIKIGGEPAVLMLIAAFGNEYSEAYPWIAYVLKEIGEAAVSPLLAALREERSETKDWLWFVWIAHVLSQIGQAALHPLIIALKDQDSSVRYWAANALGHMGNSQASGPLTSALKDEDPIVRLSAAAALIMLGDSQTIELLLAALNNEDKDVRCVASINLGITGNAQAVEPLIATLNDEDSTVCYLAIIALGDIGDSRALPALERLVKITKQLPRVLKGHSEQLADGLENPVETITDDSQAELVDDQLRAAAREAIQHIKRRQT